MVVEPFVKSLDNINESDTACNNTLVVQIDAINIAFIPNIRSILFIRLPIMTPIVIPWYFPLASNIFLITLTMANANANTIPTIPIPIYTPFTESWLKKTLISELGLPLYTTGDSPVKIIIIYSRSFIQ